MHSAIWGAFFMNWQAMGASSIAMTPYSSALSGRSDSYLISVVEHLVNSIEFITEVSKQD
jgi:hypothetical protein